MTFSICVREEYSDPDGTDQVRHGVAVTTRRPAVGSVTPYVSERGAVATQSVTNPALGEMGLAYIDDGLAAGDALQSLLNADEGSANRQLHGVSAGSTFAHTGEECGPWAGHRDGGSHTVAGNRLAGREVIDAVNGAYLDGGRERLLEERLIDALEAGYEAGGDRRGEELSVQSAALAVERSESFRKRLTYDDLRVDATEQPLQDLRSAYELAREGYREFLEYKGIEGDEPA